MCNQTIDVILLRDVNSSKHSQGIGWLLTLPDHEQLDNFGIPAKSFYLTNLSELLKLTGCHSYSVHWETSTVTVKSLPPSITTELPIITSITILNWRTLSLPILWGLKVLSVSGQLPYRVSHPVSMRSCLSCQDHLSSTCIALLTFKNSVWEDLNNNHIVSPLNTTMELAYQFNTIYWI